MAEEFYKGDKDKKEIKTSRRKKIRYIEIRREAGRMETLEK